VTTMTEIFATSEGVVIAEEPYDGIYDPYCLFRDGEIYVPSVGGEWIPCLSLSEDSVGSR